MEKLFSEVQLGDVLTFQRGFDITKAEQTDGLVPIISSSGISSFHGESKAKGPGVIIGRKGSLGTVHFCAEPYWPHDTTLWIKDFKGNDPRFLYYFLQTLHLENFDTGSSNPTLNRNHVHKIKVRFPRNADVQGKTAAILASYDDLIENNRRRITLLEKMTEEIYREWFVRMRFPGHEVAKFSKGLPEGWFFDEIGFVTDFVSRGIAPDYDETASSTVINQKCVRDGRIDLAPARNLKNEIPTEKCLQVGDVLINSTGTGTLGRVAQVLDPLKNTTVDTHLTIVRPSKKVTQHFFGMQLMQMEKHFTALGDGATNQTELKRELIRSSKIVLPAESVMLEFDRVCAPIRQQCCQLQSQIKCLKQTRDALLPRLISGKLAVEALDIQFPPGMLAPESVPASTA